MNSHQVTSTDQLDGEWRLRLAGLDAMPLDDFEAPLHVRQGRFSSHDGCNKLVGDLRVVNGRLQVDDAMITLMACEGEQPDIFQGDGSTAVWLTPRAL